MRGRLNRPLVPAVGLVLVLVGVVAVASTGSTPGGTGNTRSPSETLLDTFFTFALLALIPGAAILIYGLMQRKEIAEEIASGRYRRTSAIAMIVTVAVISGIVYLFRGREGILPFGVFGETVEVGPDGQVVVRDASANDPDAYRAEIAWIPVLVVLAIAVIGILAFALAARRRPGREAAEAATAEQLADVLDETLDDLRAEPDARRAVIAAYARLERAFAAAGVPRRRQETAEEYVPRALRGLEVDGRAVRALTDLFTTAKFSQHPITPAMKLEAISCLERIRDDLRAMAERADQPEPVPELPERPATS